MTKPKLPKMPRGEGSFFYHTNDRIGYRKNLAYPSGLKVKKTVYAETVSECLQKMKEVEKELNDDFVISDDTLYDAMVKWLNTVKKNQIKPQTYARYMIAMEHQFKPSMIGNSKYQKLTTGELQLFINSLNNQNYSLSVIQKCYNLLKGFYRYYCTVDNFTNPMTLVQLPSKYNIKKPTKEIEWFEEDDIEKFINECIRVNSKTKNHVYRNGYMYAANIYLGLRVGELVALTWKDIDLENNRITINKTMVEYKNVDYDPSDKNSKKNVKKVQNLTKTEANRLVPINKKAREFIIKHKELYYDNDDNQLVVCSHRHQLYGKHQVTETIKIIQRKAGTKVQNAATHTLRHTCASLYFKKDVKIELIAKILGHTPETCRKIYIGLSKDDIQDAADKIITDIDL